MRLRSKFAVALFAVLGPALILAAVGRASLLIFAGLALLLSGVIALLLEWLVLRRLRALIASMQALAARPSSRPRASEDGGDELADGARAFNALADAVADAQDTQEARVAERTSLLQQANAALADEVRDRRKAEEAARAAKLAAEAASRAKSEFLANMSHEVRTPLHGILGLADLTLETDLSAEQREYVSMLKSSGQALATIVNDILDFSKIEAGKLHLDPMPFGLRDAVCEALKVLAVRAHGRGLELTFEADPAVPDSLVGDAPRLRQIINNLAGNAVKFTEAGEVAVRISAEADGLLRFEVRDTGIGIPAEKLARIFEPFEQADHGTTRRYGGTGLGLTIAARLVELMGGRIGVGSEAGKGSTFWFTVPLEPSPAGPPSVPPLPAGKRVLLLGEGPTIEIVARLLPAWGLVPVRETPADAAIADGERLPLPDSIPTLVLCPAHRTTALPAHVRRAIKPPRDFELRDALSKMLGEAKSVLRGPDTGPTCRPLRVLVAEDGAVNQRLIERLLDKRGHSVRLVADGAAAVEAVGAERFDVVLMDVQMPVMDGLEATRLIREAEARNGAARLPVLALTASAMEADRHRCSDAGMDAFLTKPLRLEQLDEALSAVAEGRPLGAT